MTGDDDDGTDAAMIRRKMLQLRTLRPALDVGDPQEKMSLKTKNVLWTNFEYPASLKIMSI